MKRVESIHQQQQQQQHQQQLFPLDEFLQLLFKFTFNQPNPDRFLDCLQIWDAFVEYLNARNLEGATADVERYREGLISLAQQIIRVLLWSEEPKYLRELGFEIGSSQSNVAQAAVAEHSMESDGDLFLNSGLALVSKISDLYPIDIIQHVASLFLSYSAQLQQQLLQQQSNTGGSNTTNGLAFKYKDLLVLSRLVGQLAHFFVELGNFEENLKSTSSLVEAVLELLNLVLAQMSKVHSSTSSIQKDCDLDETRKYLCCGLYSCLRVYIHWFQKYQVHAYENHHNSTLHQSQFSNLLNTLLHTSVSTIIDQASNTVMMSPLSQQSIRPTTTRHSPNVALSASRLLVSVATVVRPGLVGFPGMRPLWSDIHGIARTLGSSCNAGGRECKFNLYKVATLAIVVPTAASKVSEEEWNIRFGQLSEFYAPLLSQFHALWNEQGEFLVNPLDMDGRNQTKHLLESFVGCMEAVSNEPMNPKNIVYMVVKSVVAKALGLYEVCSQDFDMLLALFDFTLALQVSLRRQSARENGMLVIQTLQTFMKLVESRGLLQAAASPVETIAAAGGTIGVEAAASSLYTATGTTARSKKVELLGKFLEFLTAVVQDTSKSIEGLLDHVVAFCQHSFSFIGHEDSSSESLKLHFYNLLFILLTFHQRHFFGSSVSRAASLHEREVASVLEMIAKSFSDRNMEVFRHNLNGLESLNSKCALYQKEFFQKHMMTPFIDLFLGILVSKEHDFMKEEIAGALGKIMTCNVALFIHGYVPHFMGKYCSGIHSQDQARLYNCVTSIQDNSNVVEVIYTLVTELIYIQQ
ncbi:hypothetical protein BDR26DRAFT_431229 [Obelidium mucronatum]|nr:hypothetical protein BDR26DRAFT_431229 [Obelidium mucronatum]